MNAELYARACDVFASVCDLPPAEREARLQAQCAADPDLLDAVRRMLAADAGTNSPGSTAALHANLERLAAQAVGPELDDRSLPERVGPYTVIRRLGRGAMGDVLEARQQNPDRAVALKLVRAGAAGPATIQRFRREVAFLARLTHPGIAQIYDAGIAELGGLHTPYFAMELVQGLPLTEYATKRDLTLPQRIELLARVCDAVQFAHQQGVIHRDLKPSNILVADGPTGEPSPRVLDFGIARLADEPESVAGGSAGWTLVTETGQLIGTPGFMSPEQIRNRPGAVDTRTDIYALGVLLYLLLSGQMPHASATGSAFDAARATIEEEPQRLGAVVPACRGDLETIAATAMHKEKHRRYDSAAQLATDLRRFLKKEPIAARPATTWYVARRFAARNRVLVAASGTVVALVLAAGVVISGLYLHAERQRVLAERAEREARREARLQREMTSFLAIDSFGAAAPSAKGPDVRVLEVIDDAAAAVDTRFADEPSVRWRVRAALANLYYGTGQQAKAIDAITRAVTELGSTGEEGETYALETRVLQASISMNAGDDAGAERVLREVLARTGPTVVRSGPSLGALVQLGELLQRQSRHDEGEPLLREAIAKGAPVDRNDYSKLVSARVSLAASLGGRGRGDEATVLLQEAVELGRTHLGEDHPNTLAATNNHINNLLRLSRNDEAAEASLTLLRGVKRRYPAGHERLGFAAITTAAALSSVGRHDEARPLALEALEVLRARRNDRDFLVERVAGRATDIFVAAGDLEGAVPLSALFLRCRLAAAGPDEGAGVAERAGEYAKLLRRLHRNDASRVEADLLRFFASAVADVRLIESTGGPERSPHAARLHANLALAAHVLGQSAPSVAALAPSFLSAARTALPASGDQPADARLIEVVQSALSPDAGPGR